MTEQWKKQQLEVDSYNVFFSAFNGTNSSRGLRDLGYRQVGYFLEIEDNRQGVECEPDMVFYDGTNLLLVEIKSGRNVNSRATAQMERCSSLSIESASEFLSDAEVGNMGLDPNSLTNIEPIVVYYEDVMEECMESVGCKEQLENVSEHGTVISQKKGGEMTTVRDSFDSLDISKVFSEGIELPALPETKFYLTENVNREILAYSIAHDAVLPNLSRDSRITLSPGDIIERYRHRQIPLKKVRDSLRFLSKIGACAENGGGSYTFSKSRLSNLMGVESKLRETRVVDIVDTEDGVQQTIKDWMASEDKAENMTADGGKGDAEDEEK